MSFRMYARYLLGGAVGLGTYLAIPRSDTPVEVNYQQVPSRQEQFSTISEYGKTGKQFDLLIVGGGATGSGCSLEAISRGLSTVLVEREDFASETSSKSTKLLHGGVRYLEKAILQFSYPQLKLVYEALQERKNVMENAPYLTNAIALVTPMYNYWEIPYVWAGLRLYDYIAGTQALTYAYYASSYESKRLLNTLSKKNPDGRTLKGSIIYFDGQFNDARLNLTLALSAASLGAVTLNYTQVEQLTKDEAGKVNGAIIKDLQSNQTYTVHAKSVVNSTGPFSDSIQEKSTGKNLETIQGASGIHITLPQITAQLGAGLLIPKTADGRVLFLLPWQNGVIAGTTDNKTAIVQNPRPQIDEVQFVLDQLKQYLDLNIDVQDIQSTWKGIRPLLVDPNVKDTSNLVRDHVILEDDNGLISIGGGKWTTYRLMAEQTIDKVVQKTKFENVSQSKTKKLKLQGSIDYTPDTVQQIMKDYKTLKGTLSNDPQVATYLATHYGTNAPKVLELGEQNKKYLERIDPTQPMIQAEVIYGVRHEYVQKPVDFLARRSNLAFVDAYKAMEMVPKVVDLMAEELQWGTFRRKQEVQQAIQYIQQNFITE